MKIINYFKILLNAKTINNLAAIFFFESGNNFSFPVKFITTEMNSKLLNFFIIVSLAQCVHLKDMSFFILREINCNAVDTTFCRFDQCGSQIGEDGVQNFNIILRLLKVPVTNCKLQFEFKTITDISIPLSYNNTFDTCKFMLNRSKYRVLQRFYDAFGRYTNMNHTCPYNVSVRMKILFIFIY